MTKPKFEIGDWVTVEFEGEIEGEKVKVAKKLVVTAVYLSWKQNLGNCGAIEIKYLLRTVWPVQDGPEGKQYEMVEARITPADSLENAIARANQP